MTFRHQRLVYVDGVAFATQSKILCHEYGRTDNGIVIWEDNEGRHYTRKKINNKYYFELWGVRK